MEMLGLREVVCTLIHIFFVCLSFVCFGGLFRTSDVISDFSRALLIQEWKLRIEKGILQLATSMINIYIIVTDLSIII